MKNLQKIKIGIMLLCAAGYLFSVVSCSDDDENPVKVYEYREQIGKKIKELTDLQSSSEFGARKGTYPEESRKILEDAITELKDLLESINGKTIPDAQIPDAIEQAMLAADLKMEEFKTTIRTEDVIVPAELHVNGKNGGYIDFGSHPEYSAFTSGFTVDLWFKFEGIGDFDYILSTFIDNYSADLYRKGWAVNYYGEGSDRNLRMTYSLGKSGLYEPWVRFEEAKKWIHLAFVWNPEEADDGSDSPKTFKMYIDGQLRKEEHWGKTNFTPNNEGTSMIGFNFTLYSGAISTDGKGTNGWMKHVHIWNSVKTQAQIQTIMDDPDTVTGTESDLVCGWKFTVIPLDMNDMVDLTGKYSAKLFGDYVWVPTE